MKRLIVIVALVAACAGTPAPQGTSTGPEQASACAAALVAAAGVDQNADSVSDLYPAVKACSSLAEWTAAFVAVNGAGFLGSATEVLGNVCFAPEVATDPLCLVVAGTPEPTPRPTPKPIAPASYATLTSRAWAKLIKAPDNYIGKGYKVWGCITQFDAATGPDTFRAESSFRKERYWFLDGDNTFFIGDQKRLADFVQDDVVSMSVVSLGSYSYDTQAGGNTTVPLFRVDRIVRKGSCG